MRHLLKKSTKNKLNFFLVAGGFILLFGLLIALFTPNITAWKLSVVDRLLNQAKLEQDDNQRYGLLSQAYLIGLKDPRATEAMAQYWLGRGDVNKAVTTYKDGLVDPNYVALGNLSLRAQNYSKAKDFFNLSLKEGENDEGLVGLANTHFNLGNTTAGCEAATKATKQNLDSASAKAAVASCYMLGGTQAEALGTTPQSTLSDRQVAYYLINNQVYKPGETKLLAIKDKTVGDWLVLSRLASARGEISDAIAKAEQGIALDSSNIDANKELISLYKITGENNKATEYSERLNQLMFVKYR